MISCGVWSGVAEKCPWGSEKADHETERSSLPLRRRRPIHASVAKILQILDLHGPDGRPDGDSVWSCAARAGVEGLVLLQPEKSRRGKLASPLLL